MIKAYTVAIKRVRYELVDVFAHTEQEACRMVEEEQGIHHLSTMGKVEVLSIEEKGERVHGE